MSVRVDWADSPIDLFRESLITALESGTGYRVKDTFDGAVAGDVIVTGGGWSPSGTGGNVSYDTIITCVYGQPGPGSEKGVEEMARRVYVTLAYVGGNPPTFEPVPPIGTIVLSPAPDAVRYAGSQFTIHHPLALAETEEIEE